MEKRLFFGLSVEAPWPEQHPTGRIIATEWRHVTLAFLGNIEYSEVEKALFTLPLPPFSTAPVGKADRFVFLPKKNPRVAAYHIHWLTQGNTMTEYVAAIRGWLEKNELPSDERTHLPHVTIARSPFAEKDWEDAFSPLPVVATALHLYESLGNSEYQSLWHAPLPRPFEEFPHTADIAFLLRGNDLHQLYHHAAVAMSFSHPTFLNFLIDREPEDFLDIIRLLNEMVSACDSAEGCPFKAVSYHGKMREVEGHFEWEMVVDV